MCASPINWKINLKKICSEKGNLYFCIVFSNEKLMDNGIQVSAPNGCLFFLSRHIVSEGDVTLDGSDATRTNNPLATL